MRYFRSVLSNQVGTD
jgi:quercetin dioxygenase-like cupin family protein